MSFSINTSPQLTIVIVLLILLVQELVEAVELLLLGAVQVVPPVADEVLLVEDGSIRTQERVFGETTLAVSGTNVEGLAISLSIGIIT